MKFADKTLDFDSPRIMGVLNVTPDSFSDGGKLFSQNKLDLDKALYAAEKMVREGATFIDIGGESTRPGAAEVSVAEECDRVLPVVEKIGASLDAIISIDTSTPQLMREAAGLGAGLINDVRALSREGALQAAVETGLPVCLMHMQGKPATMQAQPQYENVVEEVFVYFQQRMQAFVSAGGREDKVIFDPGFGFGKNDTHNLDLLKSLPRFKEGGQPILVGLSRKSMIGRLLGRDVEDRLAGSLALALAAIKKGADIVRVHDVQATADLLEMSKILGEF